MIIFFILLLVLFLFLLYYKNKCKENFNVPQPQLPEINKNELIQIGTCLKNYSKRENWNDKKKYSHSIKNEFLKSDAKLYLDQIKIHCNPVNKYFEGIELLNSLICKNEYKSKLENEFDSFDSDRKEKIHTAFFNTTDE